MNINQSENTESYSKILLAFAQPLTSKQVSRKTDIPSSTCRYIIGKYVQNGILICLNPNVQSSRLYWLTNTGILRRKGLCSNLNIVYVEPNFPEVNWQLYGWVCFSHRSMVIKALACPMQPSQIKKVLRLQRPDVKISANNIYDVMRLLLLKRIIRPVKVKRKAHLRYELTELGNKFRQLLLRADAVL